jgi:mycofactocin precursor
VEEPMTLTEDQDVRDGDERDDDIEDDIEDLLIEEVSIDGMCGVY